MQQHLSQQFSLQVNPLAATPMSSVLYEMCLHIKVSKASTFKHRKGQEKGNMKIALFEVCLVSCLLCVPLESTPRPAEPCRAEHGRVFVGLDHSSFVSLDFVILLLTYFKVIPSNERGRKPISIYLAP